MYSIKIYEDKYGKSEIKDYIRSLQQNQSKDSKIKFNKIISYMRLLSENGLSIGEPYIKYLDNGIWELRPLKDRILFTYWNNNRFILLSIFTKKTKKTPRNEIEKAKRLLKNYIDRSGLQ